LRDKTVVTISTVIFIITATIVFFLYQKKTSFEKITTVPTKAPEQKSTTLLFVGDIGLGREINWQIQNKKDPKFPFLKIKSEIEDADLSIANLEGPLIENCPLTRTGFKFCGQPGNALGLKFAGFDLVNLANNHTNNYGPDGFLETSQILKKNNIDYFGKEKIVYKNLNNLTLAFLGYDDIVRRLDINEMEVAVKNSRQKADIIVVSFHWGEEYQQKPNQRQRTIAYSAIDAGADIIIGHHPHTIQPLDYYRQKPIFFSLGNFLFDQLWSEQTRTGLIAKITINNKNIIKIETVITWINDQYQVERSN